METSAQLAKRLIRLVHARVDIRCAAALRDQLAELHEIDISYRAWGLLTGMVVSYARPFTPSYAYGKLEPKWSRFKDRPDLAKHHKILLHHRNTLLAHNDTSPHRRILFFTTGAMADRPAVTEGRSPIGLSGIAEVRGLFVYQEARFVAEYDELAVRLEQLEDWPPGHELELQVRNHSELHVVKRPH